MTRVQMQTPPPREDVRQRFAMEWDGSDGMVGGAQLSQELGLFPSELYDLTSGVGWHDENVCTSNTAALIRRIYYLRKARDEALMLAKKVMECLNPMTP